MRDPWRSSFVGLWIGKEPGPRTMEAVSMVHWESEASEGSGEG